MKTIIQYLKDNPKAQLVVTAAGSVEVHFNDESDLMIFDLADWHVSAHTSLAAVIERWPHVIEIMHETKNSGQLPVYIYSNAKKSKSLILPSDAAKFISVGVTKVRMTHEEFVEYMTFEKSIQAKIDEANEWLKVCKEIARSVIEENQVLSDMS